MYIGILRTARSIGGSRRRRAARHYNISARFFFHGTWVGRYTVRRTPFVRAADPVADNTSATDNRWVSDYRTFSAASTHTSSRSPWASCALLFIPRRRRRRHRVPPKRPCGAPRVPVPLARCALPPPRRLDDLHAVVAHPAATDRPRDWRHPKWIDRIAAKWPPRWEVDANYHNDMYRSWVPVVLVVVAVVRSVSARNLSVPLSGRVPPINGHSVVFAPAFRPSRCPWSLVRARHQLAPLTFRHRLTPAPLSGWIPFLLTPSSGYRLTRSVCPHLCWMGLCSMHCHITRLLFGNALFTVLCVSLVPCWVFAQIRFCTHPWHQLSI